jgi:hypothetical protein
MRRKILGRAFLVANIAIFLSFPLFAYNGAYFDYFHVPYSSSAAALGGPHAASTDGVEALLNNPAGFVSEKPSLSLGEATFSLYDSAPLLAGEVISNEFSTSTEIRRSTFSLLGPLSFSYVGNGIGFGVFNNSTIRSGTIGPYPMGFQSIEEELVIIAGYAIAIPLPAESHSSLSLGISVPIYMTGLSPQVRDLRGIFVAGVPPLDIVLPQPFTLLQGMGIEAGILYSYDDMFSFGMVARNLAITTRHMYASLNSFLSGGSANVRDVPMPLDLSAGIRATFPLKTALNIVDDITVLLDYGNILDFLVYPPGATNPLLHIGAGLEIRMFQIMRLQAGLYQCLPCAGIQLDLTLFTLSLAFFGREATAQPYGYPVNAFLIGLEF